MELKTYYEAKSQLVYLVTNYRGKRIFLSTGLRSEGKFSGVDIQGSSAKKHHLRKLFNSCEEYLALHSNETFTDMKLHLKELIVGRKLGPTALSEFITQFAATKDKEGTKKIYEMTAKRVAEYDNVTTPEDVTPDWLHGYVTLQRNKGRMTNGIGLDLRNIRAVFNWGIDNSKIENYPFRRFKIKVEETRKRNLAPEQISELKKHLGFPPVDIFFMMLYCCGINFSDLVELEPGQIRNGRLEFRRNKTGRQFSYKVEPELQELFERYKGEKYLLSFMDTREDYHSYLRYCDRALAKIIPGISTYWSRHSVASIAAQLDISVDTIGQMLGHADANHATTFIYINYDNKKIDLANRKVIDYINSL